MSTAPISTASRIHPLMAGAAISVTIISLVGAAAIAGLLPSSHSENKAANASLANAPITTPAQAAAALAPVAAAEPAPAPVAQKPRVRHVNHTQVAQAPRQYDERPYQQADERSYQQAPHPVQQAAPAPAPAQPNYVGIGTGAVIGGLLGNQVGGGRGKTLATIAGVIGGGMLGNEAQKQIQQQQPEPQR